MPWRKDVFKVLSIFTQERTWVVHLPGSSLPQPSCPQVLPEAPSPARLTGWVHLEPEPPKSPTCYI